MFGDWKKEELGGTRTAKTGGFISVSSKEYDADCHEYIASERRCRRRCTKQHIGNIAPYG